LPISISWSFPISSLARPRSWHTWHRGPLAIHAAKGFPKQANWLTQKEPFYSVLLTALGSLDWTAADRRCDLPRGCIIAVADLTGCLHIDGAEVMSETERAFGDYTPGRYRWQLTNVRRLPEPIPAKGALGLWQWTPPKGFAA